MNIMSMRWGQLYKGTPAERSLEDAVATLGVPYRTQFPGYLYGVRYFVDFLLPTLKLVIEVDDDSHRRPEKVEADRERTSVLERTWGVRVVRCTNKEALEEPMTALRGVLSSVGLWPVPNRLPTVAASLPQLRKAPQKVKREARGNERRAKRQASSSRPRRRDAQANPADPPSPT